MPASLSHLRNIGIIAHIDAGKTTVTEQMLYISGAKHRVGEVDRGTTTTDDDAEEAKRGITIYSACVVFPWNDVQINLIDTPGHVDFTAEVERSLRVLDGAVIVFSAREGVEAQSETVWRQANKYHVPRLAFINKLDREGADFEAVFNEIRERLDANPVALQIPVGLGPAHVDNPFRGVIDLIGEQMLTFPDGKEGRKVVAKPIPDDLADSAALWREELVNELTHYSDELMELALAEEPIPAELIHRVIRGATVHHQIQPVLCGSALHGIGVQPLLDAVAAYLPNPLEMPPVVGVDPTEKTGVKSKSKSKTNRVAAAAQVVRKPDPNEPFCALVFKILPYKTGDLYWVRIYSGTLKSNSRVLNPARNKKENVAQLWQIHASKKDEQLPSAQAGDIVGIIGLRDSVTGDTLCDTRSPILLESIDFPETVISMAIEPESTADKKKLADALNMLRKQDPTFTAAENEETGQTLISGMGELHLEVIQHRLQRDFKLNVKVHHPRVSYRETIRDPVEVAGECNRLINGVQHRAKIHLRMEPWGTPGVVVGNSLDHGLPPEMLAVVLEELETAGQSGGVLGFPLMRIKVQVLSGEMHETDSSEIAFRTAASLAFDTALREAGTVLLEPIMRLEISTPDEHVGDLVGDLQQRRAIIH